MRRSSHPIRAAIAAAAITAALVAGALPAAAQEAGTEVPIADEAGTVLGTILVKEVADPFTEHDPDYPAEEGSRYVGLIVAFTAADDQAFEAYPWGIVIRDDQGMTWNPGYVPRPADVKIPDAEGQTLAPGNRISGFLGFLLPEDRAIDEILYQPDYQGAQVLVDLMAGAGNPAGTPYTYVRMDGPQVDVNAVLADPFTDYAEGYEPEEGTRWVAVAYGFENTGELVYPAYPSELYLRDADGGLYSSSWVGRPEGFTLADAESQMLSPGDRITGFLAFSVPESAQIVAIDYWSEGNRRVTIGDLTAEGAIDAIGTDEPAASPVASPGTSQ